MGLVRGGGIGADEEQSRGAVGQLTSISVAGAWETSLLSLPTQTPPVPWVGWGSVLPGMLCPAAPMRWRALPRAMG